MKAFISVLGALLLAGCWGSVGSEYDTATDTAGDPPADGIADTGTDVPVDTGVDTGIDTGEDVPLDELVDPPSDDSGTWHGECHGAADCGGLPCVRVPDEPGGYWLCTDPPRDEATECTAPWPDYDECCTSADCTGGARGACFFTDGSWGGFCGGPMPAARNICIYDTCASDADCTDWGTLCMPANVLDWPRTRCVAGTCGVDADCTREAGGYCAPIPNYCCPSAIEGFFCIYPGACDSSDDCEDWQGCTGDWDTGGTRCDWLACPA